MGADPAVCGANITVSNRLRWALDMGAGEGYADGVASEVMAKVLSEGVVVDFVPVAIDCNLIATQPFGTS